MHPFPQGLPLLGVSPGLSVRVRAWGGRSLCRPLATGDGQSEDGVEGRQGITPVDRLISNNFKWNKWKQQGSGD